MTKQRMNRPAGVSVCAITLAMAGAVLLCGSALGQAAGGDEQAGAGEQSFPGWQGMRVIRQEGRPGVMRAADLDGDGRDELMVINGRQVRLEIYRWLEPGEREEPAAGERPNELPMATEFAKVEVALERVPHDAAVVDVDGDGAVELVVLTGPPNRVQIYKREQGAWSLGRTVDLLPGQIGRQSHPMLVREGGDGEKSLLLDFQEGIQTLSLAAGSKPTWLRPRESAARVMWVLTDLDGDGDADLVEWNREQARAVRWYESVDGALQPGQVLHDESVRQMASPGGSGDLFLLGGNQAGLLRRYALTKGEASPLGGRHTLPLSGEAAPWTGVMLGGDRALVAVDPGQPRLRVSLAGPGGWTAGETYPSVSDVEAVAAPGAPGAGEHGGGMLLLKTKDATDLHVSQWANGRLSYPRPMPSNADVEDRKILALASVGSTVWWVQRAGADVDLYVWKAGEKEASRTRFAGLGEKVDRVNWIGGERLLFMEQYARRMKLAELVEGKVVVSEPGHLKAASIDAFGLIRVGESVRLSRLTDGVLQWIGDDLHPTDQVMLPEGQALRSFVATASDRAWALAAGGEHIHEMSPDEAGIWRVRETYDLKGAEALLHDAVLGVVAAGDKRVTRLTAGRPDELDLVESIDSRVGRPSGEKEATMHRLMTADVTGSGREQLVISDDIRHRLTVLAVAGKELEPVLSWPVFEDKTYPYGGGSGQGRAPEPRAVVGLNFDGDDRQDLVMICHDRLLIYLGRDERTGEADDE